MNKLSIVIPTFNRAALLSQAVSSILDVTWRPLEVVIIDDGSTDETARQIVELMKRAAAKGIHVAFENQGKKGPCRARNRGFEKSSGEFVMFVDSDDIVHPKGLDELVKELAKGESDFVYGDVITVGEDGKTCLYKREGKRHPGGQLPLMDYSWHTMGAVYSRELLKKSGPWNEELSGSDDWELQARIKLHATHWKYLGATAGFWRQHEGTRLGATSFRKSYTRSVVLACRSIGEHADAMNRLDRKLRWKLAGRVLRHAMEFGLHHETGGRLEAIAVLASIVKKDPILSPLLQIYRFCPLFIDKLGFKIIAMVKGTGAT